MIYYTNVGREFSLSLRYRESFICANGLFRVLVVSLFKSFWSMTVNKNQEIKTPQKKRWNINAAPLWRAAVEVKDFSQQREVLAQIRLSKDALCRFRLFLSHQSSFTYLFLWSVWLWFVFMLLLKWLTAEPRRWLGRRVDEWNHENNLLIHQN